jgi:hypothetical protein
VGILRGKEVKRDSRNQPVLMTGTIKEIFPRKIFQKKKLVDWFFTGFASVVPLYDAEFSISLSPFPRRSHNNRI